MSIKFSCRKARVKSPPPALPRCRDTAFLCPPPRLNPHLFLASSANSEGKSLHGSMILHECVEARVSLHGPFFAFFIARAETSVSFRVREERRKDAGFAKMRVVRNTPYVNRSFFFSCFLKLCRNLKLRRVYII